MPEETTALERISAARQCLAEARSLSDIVIIRNQAMAIAAFAEAQGAGEAAQMAKELQLRSERKAGAFLADMEKHPAGRPPENRSQDVTDSIPRLADLGIEKMQSSRWQAEASVPDERFEAWVAEKKATGQELTASGLQLLAWRERHKDAVVALPEGLYRIFYADPPWQYAQMIEKYGPAERHYPTMTIMEICALGEQIKTVTAPDAILFLWTTAPKLQDSFTVIEAWGFSYTGAMFIWDKVAHNYGHYNSVRHELLLIAKKGSCLPDTSQLFDSVQSIPREEHSEKPEEFRRIIDVLYPHGERIELFARHRIDNWAAWGNEI